jgi:hypothetical protein
MGSPGQFSGEGDLDGFTSVMGGGSEPARTDSG